eukprot:CAMPEP_0119272848 /NCGR_PEP_ID=MMETSP1329-20130426/9112_1 /TAXON_ID=114041 /ORGANISM="Genus nov. species nov., Strain RCC1024" /LENGTH=136 /DNA_ID=CAMNT_0007272959 /DNA_START=68 /DNA_END=478 /DNA_ORIENTATION=+
MQLSFSLLVAGAIGASAFAPRASLRSTTSLAVGVPRIDLPGQVSDAIKGQDLKSPNELSTEEYNSYSGAAIGGTLLMLVPVAYYDGLLLEFVKCFAVSAIVGGGAGAYLSLRKDGVAEKANEFGAGVLGAVDKVIG